MEQSLLLCFSEEGQDSADEALTCISELVYNGKTVTDRAWNFYFFLINQYIEGNDFYEPAQASSLFIYMMVRAPIEFKERQFNNVTPMQMLMQFIVKVLERGAELRQEMTSMCAISLLIAVNEHLGTNDTLIINQIDFTNETLLKEMSRAETPDYKNMLIQGMMSNFWYNQKKTLDNLMSS